MTARLLNMIDGHNRMIWTIESNDVHVHSVAHTHTQLIHIQIHAMHECKMSNGTAWIRISITDARIKTHEQKKKKIGKNETYTNERV